MKTNLLLAVGALSLATLGTGCPLFHAKKDGFLDRAQAKDIRLTRQGEPCGAGERRATPEECDLAQKVYGITDCQRACLPVK